VILTPCPKAKQRSLTLPKAAEQLREPPFANREENVRARCPRQCKTGKLTCRTGVLSQQKVPVFQ